MRVKILFLFIITSFLFGCPMMLPKIADMYRFQPVQLQNAEIFPSEDQFRKNYRTVIISNFDTDGLKSSSKAFRLASSSNLSNAMTGTLEKYIRDAGVRLYDGSERQKQILIDAAKRNEMLNSKRFQHDSLDYVVFPRVNSIDTYSEFQEAYEAKNILTGKKMIVPPKCKYKVTISGTIRVYDGSSRQIVESIDLHYELSDSVDTKSRSCNNRNYVISLARKCGEKAVKNKRTKIQNCFKPVGYVEKMKTDSNSYIIKTNIGKKHKLEAKLKANIFTLKKEKDIYGKEKIEKIQVAKGRVSYVIENDSSWIIIDEPQGNPSSVIKKGDIVEINFPGTWLEGIDGIFQGR